MSHQVHARVQAQQKTPTESSHSSGFLQRTCACGGSPGIDGLCAECRDKRFTLSGSHREFEDPSTSAGAHSNSPTQESAHSFDSTRARVARSGHDFSRIPLYSSPQPVLQKKLKVNQPGDVYEQEADQVAEQVMRMPVMASSPPVDEDEIGPSLRHKQNNQTGDHEVTAAYSASPIVQDVLNSGGGQPLDTTTRAFMEPRFGHDFSKVRVHTDNQAAESARAVNAQAYTVGRELVFEQGHYAPETSEGRKLLAHELTHVVQQCGSQSTSLQTLFIGEKHPPQLQRSPSAPAETEREWANTHPGKVFQVAVKDEPASDEFMLWNYRVGEVTMRDEHREKMRSVATRWKVELEKRPELRIKVIGSASGSGSFAINNRLALARAEDMRTFLQQQGIPGDRIEEVGVGSSEPIADENAPDETGQENKARNRRIEVFLYVPTKEVAHLTNGAQARIQDFNVTFGQIFLHEFSRPNNTVSQRAHLAIQAEATVQLTGTPGSEIGFIQFLKQDSIVGVYRANDTGESFTLNYSRCTNPYLPCRDVEFAANQFSLVGEGFSSGPTEQPVTIHFRDSPGVPFPIMVNDAEAGNATLEQFTWAMEFTTVLGIRSGEEFLPLRHVKWATTSRQLFDSTNGDLQGEAAVLATGSGSGSSGDIDVQAAMALPTCRFYRRSIEADNEGCRPHRN